ncbi:S8 family peptidase [Virgibacillus halodenitrificans]|uniref:S8 family peptidase n=1 Tax=Virgibacillus halodenitrificans TaxID=1482 RepID=UPI001FB33794|nr:S8 family peptidase [Virgibacillus halodenitrificans]MCJ0929988.1 S8 family peptidase [Virgibacillus halodenitrificans]
MTERKQVWFEEANSRLDPGLVGQLMKKRKEDPNETSEDTLPVIVKVYQNCTKDMKEDLLKTCEADSCNTLNDDMEILHSLYGDLTPKKIRELKDHEAVERIFYDRDVTAFLDVATKEINAVEVQQDLGFTGKDVTIAVIDSGVFPHPDLTKPENRIVAFKDFVNKQEEPYDDNGHGTHCCGDAAGNGHQSNGKYTGPAPAASIVGVKVLNEKGGGKLSTIIRGIEWCMKHREKYGIRIISLSLGAEAYESYRDDPLTQATQKAWHSGIVVCAAAGNDGPSRSTISTPAIDPFIITVGSADDQNTVTRSDAVISKFSSRGPTIDELVKPDIYAPGSNIISLLSPGSALEKQIPERVIDENYVSLSGTSMATPICAGVIALMLEANPQLSPNDIKSILQATSQPTLADKWGYIHAKTAVEMAKDYVQQVQKVN